MQAPFEQPGHAALAGPGGVAGIVLAGGGGRRFGGPKQLAELEGRPLLDHVLAVAAGSALDRLVVVLGADGERITRELDPHGAELVVCRGWQEGQAASLRCGLAAAADADAAAVMLGDGPCLARESIARVVAAWRDGAPAARAVYRGRPGHPVVFDSSLFAPLRSLRGDVGARVLLERIGVAEVVCDDLREPADVDTPADLARLQGRLGKPPL